MTSKTRYCIQRSNKSQTNAAGDNRDGVAKIAVANSFPKHWKKLHIYIVKAEGLLVWVPCRRRAREERCPRRCDVRRWIRFRWRRRRIRPYAVVFELRTQKESEKTTWEFSSENWARERKTSEEFSGSYVSEERVRVRASSIHCHWEKKKKKKKKKKGIRDLVLGVKEREEKKKYIWWEFGRHEWEGKFAGKGTSIHFRN